MSDLSRRALVTGAAVSALAGSVALAAPRLASPAAFDPATFLADLKIAGCRASIAWNVPAFHGAPIKPPSLTLLPREGRGFTAAYGAVMAKWADAMEADPDHVERIVAHVFGETREATRG